MQTRHPNKESMAKISIFAKKEDGIEFWKNNHNIAKI